MGQTKKAIKEELKVAFKEVFKDLTDAETKLSSSEKLELREYIEKLSEGSNHTYSRIFIKKKIDEIISKRESIEDIGI